MTKQLEEIFCPRSIAVVGASDDPKKMSYLIVAGFIDMAFKGEIYLINRNDTRSIEGKALKALRSLNRWLGTRKGKVREDASAEAQR